MAVLQKIDNPYGMIQTVEHGESFSIYRSQDSTGDCEITVYPVFSVRSLQEQAEPLLPLH